MKLFVYGTLMDKHLTEKVLKHKIEENSYTLHGWKKVDMGDNYTTLIPESGTSTKGDIIDISEEDLKKLDQYEERYERKTVQFRDKSFGYTYILIKS